MQVTVLSYLAFQEGTLGGGERYFHEFARSLAAKPGVEVEAFAVPTPLKPVKLELQRGHAGRSTLRELARCVRASDVVHVHQMNTFAMDWGLLSKFALGKKLVVTDHGGGSWSPSRCLGRRRNRFVDAFAFVSEWSRSDIDPNHVARQSVILGGGGDHVLRGSADSRWTSTDFLFIGRLLPHKGPHIAIEALPAGATLRVAGEASSPEYFERLVRLAQGRQVEFIGSPADHQLEELYLSSRCVVFPSLSMVDGKRISRPELLGLVILEASACGVPVIGSDLGGPSQLLRELKQTVVPPGNLGAWREAMAASLIRSGESHLPRPTASWSAVSSRAVELYEDLLAANA